MGKDQDLNGESIQFTEGFSNSSAIDLLRELAVEGSEARERFKKDPRGAFADAGILVSDQLLPENKIVLPPVHQIKELLYYLAAEDEFRSAGVDPPLGFTVYILVWAFRWSGP